MVRTQQYQRWAHGCWYLGRFTVVVSMVGKGVTSGFVVVVVSERIVFLWGFL